MHAAAVASGHMMKPCDTCGVEISSLAKMCPHCGDPDPHNNEHETCLFGCLTLACTLLFFVACCVGSVLFFA